MVDQMLGICLITIYVDNLMKLLVYNEVVKSSKT